MAERSDPLSAIRRLVEQKKYRIRIHAVQHMIKEGFNEDDIIEVLRSGRVLEQYQDEGRCLILGSFATAASSVTALHVLCDVSNKDSVDIVTAYIPQKPWWLAETKRGRIQ